MRRSIAVLAAVVLMGATACGGSAAGNGAHAIRKVDSLTVLAAAQSKTTAAHSAKVSMDVEVLAGGETTDITAAGAFDFSRRVGTMTMHFPNPSSTVPFTIDTLFTGTTLYMHSDLFRSLAKKPWIKVDLRTFTGDTSRLGAQDPSEGLAFLDGTKSAQVVDTETVRGQKTTHYFATIDLATARAKLSGTAAKMFDRYRKLVGSTRLPVNVWIDGQGRVARMAFVVTTKPSAATNGEAVSTTITTEYYGWGTAVALKVPPASQVSDGSSLLSAITRG